MKQRNSSLAILSFFSGLMISSVAGGQTVEWLESRVQGNGCSMDDTSVFAFGDEISFVFSQLGINLSESSGAKAMNKFCNVSADARVNQGNYVAEFQQVLTYGGIKTQWGSQASIMTSAKFYGHQIKPFRVELRNGSPFDEPLVSETLRDDESALSRASWWCKPNRNPRGQLNGRIAVNGQLVGSAGGSIALSAQSFDIKYSASIIWVPCP